MVGIPYYKGQSSILDLSYKDFLIKHNDRFEVLFALASNIHPIKIRFNIFCYKI
ncbi:Uncharacterised protein [uncultured archaeon]|nr:Uncharacterised protein [uncultured archaeon]